MSKKTFKDKLFWKSYNKRRGRSFYKKIYNKKLRKSFDWRKEDYFNKIPPKYAAKYRYKSRLYLNYNYLYNLLFKYQNKHIDDFLKQIKKELHKKNLNVNEIVCSNRDGEFRFVFCGSFELNDENIIVLK